MRRLTITLAVVAIACFVFVITSCGGAQRPNMFKDFEDKEALCLAYSVYPDEMVETARGDHHYDEFNTDQIRHDLAEVCK